MLKLEGKCDDSAAIYLNGTELARIGLPPGVALPHAEFGNALGARAAVGDGDAQDVVLVAPRALLHSGDNLIAVLLKQSILGSSDLTMGLRVTALVSSSLTGPRLSISRDGSKVTLT